MSSKLLPLCPILCLAALIVFAVPTSSFPSDSGVFIDWDGDGFDDNAPDDDGDGIPDEFEGHGFVSASVGQLEVSQLFTGSGPVTTTAEPVTAGESFGRRSFATRAVRESRSDFDEGFGSELGLGGGLGAGGGCAGGVCF